MKYYFNIVFFFFITSSCVAQDRDVQSKIKYYTEKAQNYLDKEKALDEYYSIDKVGIRMFASAKDKLANKTEFFIKWEDVEVYKRSLKMPFCSAQQIFENYKAGTFSKDSLLCSHISPEHPYLISNGKKLQFLKIAIDAGHIANDFETGDLEKKFIKIKSDSIRGQSDSLEIAEGMLTYATAKILKEKLEAEGAQTFSTRVNGFNAFGISFDDWLDKYYASAVDSLFKEGKFNLKQKEWLLGPKALKRDKFREVFKDLELAKRAEIINNYKPDFTIIIHYNVDETNIGWNKSCSKDFNMTFVGGAFMKNDLSSQEKRFEFLRLLITDDLERSIKLSAAVMENFESTLNVKTAKIPDAKYLYKGCLPTSEKGVFCRNLQLPRFIHSPLVYGETLYQDNITECKLLSLETDKTKNKRVQQVADAYYQGILDYVNSSAEKTH
jgi:N-acetylmuramoyl-L-alanine amidase